GVHVHEVVAVVLVEKLHVLFVVLDQLDLLTGAERVVDDLAQPHVLELGTHEGPALARLDVLEVDDGVRLPVEHDPQPLLELRRRDLHGRSQPFRRDRARSAVSSRSRAPTLSASFRKSRVNTTVASSARPCSRHSVPKATVPKGSSASCRAPPESPIGAPARSRPSSARDSRSPGSRLAARSRCWVASSRRPSRRWASAASR